MPSSNDQVARREYQSQQLSASQAQKNGEIEEHEINATANGSVGLSLNIFATLGGIFKGRSTKTTDTEPDGSSHSVENSKYQGDWTGDGNATLDLIGSGNTEKKEIRRTIKERGSLRKQDQIEARGVETPKIEQRKQVERRAADEEYEIEEVSDEEVVDDGKGNGKAAKK